MSSPREYSLVHLETDASLNMRRFTSLEDGTRHHFAGGGAVLRTISMRPITHAAIPLGFVQSSDEAECLALIAGLQLARQHGAKQVFGRTDNVHLVEFVTGKGDFHRPEMAGVAALLRNEVAALSGFILRWSPSFHGRTRGDGVPAADFLARHAARQGVQRYWGRRSRK